MKRKNKVSAAVLIVLLLLVALYLVFFNSRTNKQGITPRPVDTALNLSGKKITVLTNNPHIRASEALADWFHEETGAVVQTIVINYEEMAGYALKDIASTDPQLDIIMFWYVDLGGLVEKGALADLTDFIRENEGVIQPDDYISSLYDPYTLYLGRRWALPYDGDTHVLFYRKSLFEKYHLSPPETWDDYLLASKTITENEKANGIFGSAIMAPRNPMIIVSSYMNRLGCYGGELLDRAGRPAINSREAIMALTAMVEQSRSALPSPLETDWEVSRDAFLAGKVAMVEQWTDIGVMAEDPSQSMIRGDWGVAMMPVGAGNKSSHKPALNAGFSLGISSKAPNAETAGAYLLFVSRPDTTLRLNLINGGIDPVRVSVLRSKEYKNYAPELYGAVQASIEGAAAWPTVPQTPQLLDILTKYLIMALDGRIAPSQALEEVQAQWLSILDKGKS